MVHMGPESQEWPPEWADVAPQPAAETPAQPGWDQPPGSPPPPPPRWEQTRARPQWARPQPPPQWEQTGTRIQSDQSAAPPQWRRRPVPWGPTAPPPQPGQPPHAESSRRPSGILAVTVVIAVAISLLGAAGLAGLVIVGGREEKASAPVNEYPSAWDPRVTDLVAFVERERGLTFKHPVLIDFLDEATFRRVMIAGESADEPDEAEIKSTTALLRAVGFLSGDVDIMAAGEELAGDGIIGAYVPEVERVVLRGESLDDAGRATLVHELTHVLQDQHFDIGSYRSDDRRTSGEVAAYTAAVEADAEDIEEAWTAALPAAARDALLAAQEARSAGADYTNVPEVFIELMGFPYAYGPTFLHAVEAQGGAPARNRLFTDPPTSEEHILLPQSYLDHQPVLPVKVPGLMGKEKGVDQGDVGMLSLLVMLTERVDFGVAWPAVQGWAGDAYVAFERAGATCVRARVEFDEPAQAQRFVGVFGAWAKGRPATYTRNEKAVVFESCDPGTAAAGRAGDHVSGIDGLGLREAVIGSLTEGGASPKTAACVGDGLLERMTADRIADIFRAKAKADAALVREIQGNIVQLLPGCQ